MYHVSCIMYILICFMRREEKRREENSSATYLGDDGRSAWMLTQPTSDI